MARNLAGRLTGDQVVRVEANLEAQRANLEVGSVERGVALDEEFHTLFCEFLGNQEIMRVMGQLSDKVHRVIAQVFTINASRMVRSYEEHRAIAEANFAGDSAMAARQIEEHLQFGKLALLSPRRARDPPGHAPRPRARPSWHRDVIRIGSRTEHRSGTVVRRVSGKRKPAGPVDGRGTAPPRASGLVVPAIPRRQSWVRPRLEASPSHSSQANREVIDWPIPQYWLASTTSPASLVLIARQV